MYRLIGVNYYEVPAVPVVVVHSFCSVLQFMMFLFETPALEDSAFSIRAAQEIDIRLVHCIQLLKLKVKIRLICSVYACFILTE